VSRMEDTTGLSTFSVNVTLDGCVHHQQGIGDDETHAFFTRLTNERGAMLWVRVTYEMLESYWPALVRGDEEARGATATTSSATCALGVQKLKDATPAACSSAMRTAGAAPI